ncbi:MAG TPA: hypothetical protein ENJ27_01665 [Candidatus Moranbacteria bacterium]|nr:hypothetical protein [Candidatus Moranbacteria bacterium]
MENLEKKLLTWENESLADFEPEVVVEKDGSKTYIIRGVFPKIDSLKSMPEKMSEHFKQEEYPKGLNFVEGFPPDYKKSEYDYKKMIPYCGSPSSIEMPDNLKLTVGFVRHLEHSNNKVSEETQRKFQTQAEKIVDSLGISPDDAVYIITSTLASYVGDEKGAVERFSRTDGTAKVIADILREKGIDFKYNRIQEGSLEKDSVVSRLRPAIDEFPITSQSYYMEMKKRAKANREAKKRGNELPYPDISEMDPTVVASFVENPKELEEKAGIGEVSSATVARTLKGLEALDDCFLRDNKLPKDKKRAVVIIVGHGQFGTDISEAFLVATDEKFPVLLMGNGGFWKMNSDINEGGQNVKEFIINDKLIKG